MPSPSVLHPSALLRSKLLILGFCITPLCLCISLVSHSCLLPPLLPPSLVFFLSLEPLITASFLFSFYPLLPSFFASSLWFDSAPLLRQGYRQALAIVTSFPCSLLGITATTAAHFSQTRTPLINPCRSHGTALTRLFVGLVQMQMHRRVSLGSMHYPPSHITLDNEQCSKPDYLLSSYCTSAAVITSQEKRC